MSERLTEEALRGIQVASEGTAYDTRTSLCAMLKSLLADRAAQQAEITRLVARAGELEEECDEYVAEQFRLNFEAIEYRAALEPFADSFRRWKALAERGECSRPREVSFEWKELRRAAKAMEPQTTKPKD